MKNVWQVHVLGPDDIIPMDSEIQALRQANALNCFISSSRQAHVNDPHYPWSMAIVERDGAPYMPLPEKGATE